MKHWITLHEPICTAWLGYGTGEHAPGGKDAFESPFLAGHTLLRAHAKAYHTYVTEFKSEQEGMRQQHVVNFSVPNIILLDDATKKRYTCVHRLLQVFAALLCVHPGMNPLTRATPLTSRQQSV